MQIQKRPSFSLFDVTQLEVEENYPIIDFVVSHSNLMEDSKEIMKRVFPQWQFDKMVFTQCKDGITNKRKNSFYRKLLNANMKIKQC